MATETDPVLDLSTTLNVRRNIRIDGEDYPLRSIDEFSLRDYQRQSDQFKRISKLSRSKQLSRAQDLEQKRIVDELTRAVLMAPDAVHKRLIVGQKMQILLVFSQLLSGKAVNLPGAAARGRRRRSAKR